MHRYRHSCASELWLEVGTLLYIYLATAVDKSFKSTYLPYFIVSVMFMQVHTDESTESANYQYIPKGLLTYDRS